MHHEFLYWLLVLKFEHWAVFHQTIGEVVLCLDLLEVVHVIYSTLEVREMEVAWDLQVFLRQFFYVIAHQ